MLENLTQLLLDLTYKRYTKTILNKGFHKGWKQKAV